MEGELVLLERRVAEARTHPDDETEGLLTIQMAIVVYLGLVLADLGDLTDAGEGDATT